MRFNVEIEFNVPENITEEQFEEWFKYEIINWGSCSCKNPLMDKSKNDLVSNFRIRKW